MIHINTESKKVTNLDYLRSLSKGNAQFMQEMIDTFLMENPKEIEALEKAIQGKDFEGIKRAAHHLQSSLPFVGLNKIIQDEVYEIEKIATEESALNKTEPVVSNKSAALKKIEVLFPKVKEMCEKSHQELKNGNGQILLLRK